MKNEIPYMGATVCIIDIIALASLAICDEQNSPIAVYDIEISQKNSVCVRRNAGAQLMQTFAFM